MAVNVETDEETQLIIAQMNKILAGAGTLIVFLFKKLI